MFVVKKPFKSFGKVYTVGTVIAVPTDIKLFKSKLAEGKIIEVTEQTYDSASKYFKGKFGVALPPIKAENSEAGDSEAEKAKPTGNVTKKVSTAVVK